MASGYCVCTHRIEQHERVSPTEGRCTAQDCDCKRTWA
jgi:hypothetical protein